MDSAQGSILSRWWMRRAAGNLLRGDAMRTSWGWLAWVAIAGCSTSGDGDAGDPREEERDYFAYDSGLDSGDSDTGHADSDADEGGDSDGVDTDAPSGDDSDVAADTRDTDTSPTEDPEDLANACIDGVPPGDGFDGSAWVDLEATLSSWFREHPIVRITNPAQWDSFAIQAELSDKSAPIDFETQQLVVMSYYVTSTCGVSELDARVVSFGFAAQPYIEWRLQDLSLGCSTACDMVGHRVRAMALPKATASLELTPQVCVAVEPGCSDI